MKLLFFILLTFTTAYHTTEFKWGETKVQGVSLGGWLVLEGFITPSLFENAGPQAIDEWTFCETLGEQEALKRLQAHWSTFVTYSDFNKIKSFGLNVVRIPVGYWAFDSFGGPFVQGAAEYLAKGIKWARKTGLKVIIDLHGAPKSQNGWDHSGRKGALAWGDEESVNQTLQVIAALKKYAKSDVVIAIELLNEPILGAISETTLKNFYTSGYNIIHAVSNTSVMLSDSFMNPWYWDSFLPDAHDVIIDHHEYQVFGGSLKGYTVEAHKSQVCLSTQQWTGGNKLQIMGEWSAALTDCAYMLNGRYWGNRYEGTFGGFPPAGNCTGRNNVLEWSQDLKDEHRMYIEAQLDSFEEKTAGWVFWNLKTEGNHEWDFQALVAAGVFPQPFSDRRFPRNQCW